MLQTFRQNNAFLDIGNRVNRFATDDGDRYFVRMSIGQRIKKFRKAKGLSQTALGQAVGAAQTTIAGYESDSSEPNTDMLRRIAHHLEVSPGVIAFGGIDAGTARGLSYAPIVGKIELGAWRGEAILNINTGSVPFVPHPSFPADQQLAFQISDRSCDLISAPGGHAVVIPFDLFPGGINSLLLRERPPLVVLERRRNDTFEYTLHEMRNDGGKIELHSKSTEQRNQVKIPVNQAGDTEDGQIAFVVISIIQNMI